MHRATGILLAFLAVAGIGYSQFTNDAGGSETVNQYGEAMVVVKTPPDLSDNARIGETAFNAKCATCHGVSASGQEGIAPPLVHKIYEPGHHADISFVLAVQRGVRSHHWRFGDMPPVDGLTRADVTAVIAVIAVIAYIRELQRANGIN